MNLYTSDTFSGKLNRPQNYSCNSVLVFFLFWLFLKMVKGGEKNNFWTTITAFQGGSNMNLNEKGKAVLDTLLTFMHLK